VRGPFGTSDASSHRELEVWSTTILLEDAMTWTKPEFEVVELGMEVGAYAGNA
jgi:coenzyme PQQ precursor peptide PqqA